MKDLFVDYDLAQRLQELGFDEPCIAWYNDENLQIFGHDVILDSYAEEEERPLAPTWEQAFSWIRVKYNIHCNIDYSIMIKPVEWFYCTSIIGSYDDYIDHSSDESLAFDSYEEAREMALYSILNYIQNEKHTHN